MTEADTAGIAEHLHDVERSALLWLPEDGGERRSADRTMLAALIRLRGLGLCDCRLVVPGYQTAWQATQLGRAVRRFLRRAPEPQ